MKTSEILQEAHDFLATHKWTRGAYARDAAGSNTSPRRGDAKCFCAIGAASALGYSEHQVYGALNRAVRETHPQVEDIIYYNDKIAKEKRDVLRKFRRAITMAKRDEAQAVTL